MTRVTSNTTMSKRASLKAFLKPLAVFTALSASAAPALAGTILLDSFNDNGVGGAPTTQPQLVLFQDNGTAAAASSFIDESTLSTSIDFMGTERTTTFAFNQTPTPPDFSVGISKVSNSQISSESPLDVQAVLDLDYSWAPAAGNIFNGASNFLGLQLEGVSSIQSGGATTAFDLIIDIVSATGLSTYSNSFTPTGSDIDIAFADFTGTADFANALEINFSFTTGIANAANDFLLGGINVLTQDDPVSVVPLPAALPLLLLGIGTLGAIRSARRT